MRKTLFVGTALATIVVLGAPVYAQAPGVANFGGSQQQRVFNEAAQTQGVPIMVSPAGIRMIQQKLNAGGYNAGPLTGNWDRASAFAMVNFQKAVGLEPSGNVNLASLHALGLMGLLQGRTEPSGPAGGFTGQRSFIERAVGPGTPLHVSPAGVRLIQQALNKAGYTVGNLTGNWDQETATAARNFQAANNLEPNGMLDFPLITALRLQEILNGLPAPGSVGGQRRLQQAANGKGAVIFASPAEVRLMKQALNRAGYDVGPVNPKWDQRTHSAVANFQQATNLEPTGTLDLPLITALHLWPAFMNPQAGAMAQAAIQGGIGGPGGEAGARGGASAGGGGGAGGGGRFGIGQGTFGAQAGYGAMKGSIGQGGGTQAGGGQGGYGSQGGNGGNQGFGQGGMQAGTGQGGYGNQGGMIQGGMAQGGYGSQGGYGNQGFGQGGGYGAQAGNGRVWVYTPANNYSGRPTNGGGAGNNAGANGTETNR
jgi:hypothetical protein